LQSRLEKVEEDKRNLILSFEKLRKERKDEHKIKRSNSTKCNKTSLVNGDKTPSDIKTDKNDIVTVVTEQNNNHIMQFSFYQQIESIEGMLKHILETKDPPKRMLRRV